MIQISLFLLNSIWLKVLMKVFFVDLKIQCEAIRDEILKELDNVCKIASFILESFVKNFMKNFTKYTRTKYTIGLKSGTFTVQLAVQDLINPRDEVIIITNTFIATTEAITSAGTK